MVKHFIAVGIVDHRLVNMPHLLTVTGERHGGRSLFKGIEPMRGMAFAAVLSGMLWTLLIAAVA